MAAEIGGVEWCDENCYPDDEYPYLGYSKRYGVLGWPDDSPQDKISILDFINKLRMTEEEAEKLEDDRVELRFKINFDIDDGCEAMIALNDHYFKTNEDGTEVTLHKR